MKIKLLTCLLALLASVGMMAQKVPVTGTVTDQVGPVIGASVVEKGTANGTMTDIDGHFSLNVSKGSVIVISSIGYATQEITVGDRTDFTVKLAEDNEFLDEVVVVGYGTMKKSDLSGASVSMKEEDLKATIVSSLDQTLQGRAAGVQAVTTSGAPGSSSSIRVRGQATINANAEPLYVIDGVIVQGGGNSGADFGLGDALGNGKVSTISPLSTLNPAHCKHGNPQGCLRNGNLWCTGSERCRTHHHEAWKVRRCQDFIRRNVCRLAADKAPGYDESPRVCPVLQ